MLLSRFLVGLALASAISTVAASVSYDNRSFLIDDKRVLFVGGSFHYPRAPRSEWNSIFSQMKEQGINLIQTYVFWDIHEPQNNQWQFHFPDDSSNDMLAFVREAGKHGLFVNLRISGYVCAEWNYGGLPVWTHQLNVTLRSYNDVWLKEMTEYVSKVVDEVKHAHLLHDDGGPIVMLQIENEYGNVEQDYGVDGAKYVNYLVNYAQTLDVGSAVWIMCQQGEGTGTNPPANIINTCNGFYCDQWIASHALAFPNQPHMFTENWPGWFQHFGEPVPHRPTVDVAYSVAAWFAKGGSYMNYYMAFGGTTFGRSVGGPSIVTSYDYDVQINEYTFKAEPKYSSLQQLHLLLHSFTHVLLTKELVVTTSPTLPLCESYAYGKSSLVFLVNGYNNETTCLFGDNDDDDNVVVVAPWSVSVMSEGKVLYNTKTTTAAIASNHLVAVPLSTTFAPWKTISEPFPLTTTTTTTTERKGGVKRVESLFPLEQLSLTNDTTDYLWYSTTIPRHIVNNNNNNNNNEEGKGLLLSFEVGAGGSGLVYVFVGGEFVGTNIDLSPTATTTARDNKNPLKVRMLIPSSFLVNNNNNNNNKASDLCLDILSVSVGLINYGAHYDTTPVGIISNVTLHAATTTTTTPVSHRLEHWVHSIGLVGEAYDFPHRKHNNNNNNNNESNDCAGNRLCWYLTSFATPTEIIEQAQTTTVAVAFDFGNVAFGKGLLWLNGHCLGRLWDAVGKDTINNGMTCDDCNSNSYVGPYSSSSCRTECNQASQRLYKVPLDWLLLDGRVNELVMFNELPSDLSSFALVQLHMETTTTTTVV